MEPYTEDPYEPEMKEISKGDDTMLSFFSSYNISLITMTILASFTA